jgi:predicted phage terminase large subunit-like protein|nr:MAG TPA: Large subunit terminase [Caudoviricetes sp.]
MYIRRCGWGRLGKTFALLLESLRHVDNGGFGAVFFRRNMKQIMNEGGLWDTAIKMYLPIGGVSKLSPMPTIIWPSGAKITFSHLQLKDDVLGWQGSQVCLICFDELTHFEESQFWYMLSRNRSTCGVRPYVRASTNPDVNSWVADLIKWWIDQDTGYPIPERSGVIRYMYRQGGEIIWDDSREQLAKKVGVSPDKAKTLIKSFTFVASSIFDNKILLEKDPSYLANLNALTTVDRERLLHGNWKIRPAEGLIFSRTAVSYIDVAPTKLRYCRKWDLAATEPSETNRNPDATAGVLLGVDNDGNYYVLDVIRRQENAASIRRLVLLTAELDKKKYRNVTINISQDPGQAGKEQAQSYIKMLAGYKVVARAETGDKVTRAEPLAAQWQAGNVYIVKGDWNGMYVDEMEKFPDGEHDDMVDASSGAFNELTKHGGIDINPSNLRPKFRW